VKLDVDFDRTDITMAEFFKFLSDLEELNDNLMDFVTDNFLKNGDMCYEAPWTDKGNVYLPVSRPDRDHYGDTETQIEIPKKYCLDKSIYEVLKIKDDDALKENILAVRHEAEKKIEQAKKDKAIRHERYLEYKKEFEETEK